MSRNRVSSIVGIVAALAIFSLGVFAIFTVLASDCGGDGDVAPQSSPEPSQDLIVRDFSEYTWEELARIAHLMEDAPDEVSARGIAATYNLVDAEGAPTASTHRLELGDGTACDVRLVGIMHDTQAGTGAAAALTFMTSPIAQRRINPTASSAGGWEASEIRGWLATEGMALLPHELSSQIVTVRKYTNNVGKTASIECVTATTDALWLFSCTEVCGPITWLEDEFGGYSDGADGLLNAEGSQYEGFARAGVDQTSDAASYLVLCLRGKPVAWWYRTPYAFEFLATTDDAFYQVSATGYASAVNLADDTAGIVVGFCL